MATDPVCGMRIPKATAEATSILQRRNVLLFIEAGVIDYNSFLQVMSASGDAVSPPN